ALEIDPSVEPTHVAMAHGDVLSVAGVDAVSPGSIPRSQAADLEIVAVDGDVVGVDPDGTTACDGGAQVLVQAPHALGGDGGGQRIDEAGAVVVALGGHGAAWRTNQPGKQCECREQATRRKVHGGFLLVWRRIARGLQAGV